MRAGTPTCEPERDRTEHGIHGHVRHHTVAHALAQTGRSVHQVAQRVRQVRVVHRSQRLLRVGHVRAVGGAASEVVAARAREGAASAVQAGQGRTERCRATLLRAHPAGPPRCRCSCWKRGGAVSTSRPAPTHSPHLIFCPSAAVTKPWPNTQRGRGSPADQSMQGQMTQ